MTLSTLGYGDIIPISHPTRNLAALEAVLVARLVGLHLVHSQDEKNSQMP